MISNQRKVHLLIVSNGEQPMILTKVKSGEQKENSEKCDSGRSYPEK